MRLRTVGVLVLAGISLAQVYSQQPGAASIPTPESPARPAAVERHAPSPPKVMCHGDTLSISANSSSLGAILTEIEKCTGVQFDVPAEARETLIFDDIPTGSTRDVISTLLSSSGFDYVLTGSTADPDKIDKLILMARDGSDAETASAADGRPATPLRQAFARMREAARPKTPEMQQALAAKELGQADPSAASSETPGSADPDAAASDTDADASITASPDATSSDTATPAATPAAAPPPDSPEKTGDQKQASPTDDKITSMEKLFEQRRQMVQQTQAPRPTPPSPPPPQ